MAKSRNTDFIRLWVEPATKQANDDLYPLVALGDEAAREKMIQSNIGLVMHHVDRFIAFHTAWSHLRDDLIAAGMVGLVEAVNHMAAKGFVDDANATALLSICVQQAIGKAIESEPMIPVPPRTYKRKRDQGVNMHLPTRDYSVSTDYGDNLEIIDRSNDDDKPLPPVHTKATPNDPKRLQDLRRIVEAACEDDTDREIVRLREEGYVDREIAERLGLPLTTLYVMRRTIYARFLELSGFKGQP